MKRLCLFCGSNVGDDSAYVEAAVELSGALAERGIGLVYGGGNVGLMGLAADALLARGGEVFGVIPEALVGRELAHRGLTQLHVVRSMHECKTLMAELSDGFVALPGGFGTLDELCEILTWAQLGLHRKPCGLLNVAGFFDAFLAQVARAVRDHFIRPEHQALLLVESEPRRLLERMREFRAPATHKWIERDQPRGRP
jgi:uncharacterized protein (TIGR00730 family)